MFVFISVKPSVTNKGTIMNEAFYGRIFVAEEFNMCANALDTTQFACFSIHLH
jgi:hypothetical protein